ncbi:synaptic vesicle transporter [Neohortaea acidophila]|uniref:Cercosporin MFS transporter CTB4 n=1 Tax=Neohortaea acidophila TaxID=245834 RepID=A0A6A6Q5N1_9PEZI|nr:synaptic vesicle transporter [Neohortaea acidophila]KAF2487690.1 synaptic vesicle transporter [Neohortaea acidophila]
MKDIFFHYTSTTSHPTMLGSEPMDQDLEAKEEDVSSTMATKEEDVSSNNEERHDEQSRSNVVDWDGPDDPANPQNWSTTRKLLFTFSISLCTFTVSFGSSVLSSGTEVLSAQYGVSPVVITLTLSLYVLGFAAGPWVWAPLSEYRGRCEPFLIGYVGFICFTVGVATAQNLYTIMICRFMQGAWGVSTITVVPGQLVDVWDQSRRSLAMMAWGATIVVGPTLGPIIGSFTVKNESLGWRWTMWFTLIIAATFLVTTLIVIRETWAPVLLQRKARRLRQETGNWAIHSKLDEQPTNIKQLLQKYGLKPMLMLIHEPILAAVTLYLAFIYGIIYLTFEAYPYAFGTVRGWEDGVSTLPFLSLGVGYFSGFAISFLIQQAIKRRKAATGQASVPEDQLPPMIVGSFIFIIGMFWFAWTSNPHITWVPQVLSGGFIGAGIFMLFLACLTYLMECYAASANSALAANTIVRSMVAAGFPLFATAMYHNLGVPWASSVLAFLAIAMTPFPIIFYLYGKKIRSWSKYAF